MYRKVKYIKGHGHKGYKLVSGMVNKGLASIMVLFIAIFCV